jgi:MFS transporter, ACS family, tartrate transporter
MNGVLGLRGWQWVFISEAAPAVILSFVVLWKMIDRPSHANWLEPDERQWPEKELDGERAGVEAQGRLALGKALKLISRQPTPFRALVHRRPDANAQGSRDG